MAVSFLLAAAGGTTAQASAPQASGVFAVGRQSVVLVDRSRPTPADPQRRLPALPYRRLPVLLLYPAKGQASASGMPVDNARPAPGRFPVVMFSHGITSDGAHYTPLLQTWARAGYVVAAPTFPLSGPGAIFPGDSVDVLDYQNQPADVSFVITSLLAGDGGTGFLTRHINPEEIAAAGHSLGAVTTLGLVDNSCCLDRRVKAAISLAGIELPFPGGTYINPRPTPLLLVHGAADTTVPISIGSDAIFPNANPPVYYLRYTNAGHGDITDSPIYRPETSLAAVAFLDATLRHHPRPLRALPAQVAASGLGTWQQKLPLDSAQARS